MTNYDLDFATVRKNYPIRDYARRIFTQPAKSMRRYDVYFSPFGGPERTPSFNVFEDGFKDFGASGESGDVIKLCALNEGFPITPQGLKEAAYFLMNQKPPAIRTPAAAADSAPSTAKINLRSYAIEAAMHGLEHKEFFAKRGIDPLGIELAMLGARQDYRHIYKTLKDVTVQFNALRYCIPNTFGPTFRNLSWRVNDADFLRAFYSHPKHGLVMDDLKELARRAGHDANLTDQDIVARVADKYRTWGSYRVYNAEAIATVQEDGTGKPKSVPYVLLLPENKQLDVQALYTREVPAIGVPVVGDILKVLPALVRHIPLIYIVHDNDKAGEKNGQKVHEALGRGVFAPATQGYKDIGEMVANNVLSSWLSKLGLGG